MSIYRSSYPNECGGPSVDSFGIVCTMWVRRLRNILRVPSLLLCHALVKNDAFPCLLLRFSDWELLYLNDMLLTEIQNQMHFLKEVTDAVKWQGGLEVLYALFQNEFLRRGIFMFCFLVVLLIWVPLDWVIQDLDGKEQIQQFGEHYGWRYDVRFAAGFRRNHRVLRENP